MPTEFSSATTRAAHRLLSANPGCPEDNIRQDIGRLLDSINIDNLLTYRTPSGPADIYLPRRRVFIEVKAVGLADDPNPPQARENVETPFQQVLRYLTAERDDELGRLPLDEQPDQNWTAIVTDGRIWHAWQFPHRYETMPTDVVMGFKPESEAELLRTIVPIVSANRVGKPWIPANPVPIFAKALETLRTIHAEISDGRVRLATETKRRLWLDMLRGSGMSPATEETQIRLFTAHCFLVTLARGVVHSLLKPNINPDPEELLGNGYLAWIIEIEAGRNWACKLLNRIHEYEWRRTAGDVLRPLYEQFVDQRDRKDFGEVYTPDWLAELLVAEVLDDEWCNEAVVAALTKGRPNGIGVLDPTCGSGTFLFHCARRILASKEAQSLSPVKQADVVCRLVHGIDIHPVAVEFSRATLLRALPTMPTAADMAPAVYQGDALMLRQTDKNTLFDPRDGEILIRSPQQREILIPRTFSEHPDFADMLRRVVDSAASGEQLPLDIGTVMGKDKAAVEECHKALTEIIETEGNSVWTWYITNVLGPDRLARQKVNRIVANPPWVKLSKIQVPERRRALESLAGKENKAGNLDLWTGGKQAPHFDIAQLFIRHARHTYLNEPDSDPAAWVTKVSAIRAGNWEQFRKWHNKVLSQSLNLSKVKVFGGGDARRSCVLFEKRPSSLDADDGDDGGEALKATCPTATPVAHMSWEREAKLLIQWQVPIHFPEQPSGYLPNDWRQGATIVPKVLTYVAENKPGLNPDARHITTVRSEKDPWSEVQPRAGEVPAHWLLPLLDSKQLLPFGLAPTGNETIIVPCGNDGKLLSVEVAQQSDFWTKLDVLYRKYRGQGGNTPKTLINRIDYGRNLSAQLPLRSRSRHLVIYPASGDVMRAAHIPQGLAVSSSKIYWRAMGSLEEARYLVAILNAPSLEKAFKLSRTSGRDFHKAPWRSVPIPAWDKANGNHRELAALAKQAEKTVKAMKLSGGQVAASKRIRERLKENGMSAEIDSLVRVLLPNHIYKG